MAFVFRLAARLILPLLFLFVWTTESMATLQPSAASPEAALRSWYKMVLELVRHTPTYSPPVASRSFAYLGVTAYEVAASGSNGLQSLAGQLNGLETLPVRETGAVYDETVVMQAALAESIRNFFINTGPAGQRAFAAMEKKLSSDAAEGVTADVVSRSASFGKAIADHVLAWSQSDGGAIVENMGFPTEYALAKGPAHWVPTSAIVQQQTPLLPQWGSVRPFAMPSGTSCPLPPPPEYSEDKSSEFYKQSDEVYTVVKNLTPEQKAIARFWSDDPMLSPTPPGHWLSIALQILDKENADEGRSAEVLAKLGIALADSFIGCWNTKFEYDLLRPVTYIKRVIDKKWEPVLITPPFPEYPSGHSTQSSAAADVLTSFYGENFAFQDATHEREGIKPRVFASFADAAKEAGISRLFGGIHFRAAIERGLDQGHCIGKFAIGLRTRK
jgi:hypothetical protein